MSGRSNERLPLLASQGSVSQQHGALESAPDDTYRNDSQSKTRGGFLRRPLASIRRAAKSVGTWFGVDDAAFAGIDDDDADDDFADRIWFHGMITEAQSEQRLRKQRRRMLLSRIDGDPDGLFLFRITPTNDIIVSVFCNAKVWHIDVIRQGASFALEANKAFPSLDQLILYYQEQQSGPLPCPLRFICKCPARQLLPTQQEYAIANHQEDNAALAGETLAVGSEPLGDKQASASATASHDGAAPYKTSTSSKSLAVSEFPGGSSGADAAEPRYQSLDEVSSTDMDADSSSPSTDDQQPPPQPLAGSRASQPQLSERDEWLAALEYSRPEKPPKAKQEEKVKRIMASLPTFSPYFVNIVTLAQLIIIFVFLVDTGISDISFKPSVATRDVQIGFGLNVESLTVSKPANVFIGPPNLYLIRHGAQYTPCMRKDIAIFADYARQREEEEQFYGCCTLNAGDVDYCGFTYEQDCLDGGGNFTQGQRCPDTCTFFRLRPCCTQFNGTCEITTEDYCSFVSGIYHTDAQSCSEVSCLKSTCGFSMPKPEKPNQWYRFLIPVFLHAGIIHVIICHIIQTSLATRIERTAGWLRMALIYIISAFGGNLVSGIFAPEFPVVGCSGAICGCLGTELVRIINFWPGMKKPWKSLAFVIFQILLLLMLGTLPWVDNFAHIGGLIFGTLAACVFLPYVTFGKWDKIRKRILLIIALPAILLLALVLLFIFYETQGTDFCEFCDFIQCVPYTSGLCDDMNFG